MKNAGNCYHSTSRAIADFMIKLQIDRWESKVMILEFLKKKK
ncbi:hypothetical protein M595_5259 [Lyngbya aestuarii BL J]|uniref:Uncharacterized protein n=1 Tax=Lyngbya aestuarii BL J TaxID=1348334 RepID=U7QCN6_9CYAN|nr:hypothetical protein M595_5259 [Lyngbya aestuarii BL J]